jgi:enoyl-CoA hydratase
MRRGRVGVEDGEVVVLRLSGTPLGLAEARELFEALAALIDIGRARVLIVTSTGVDFCPGPAADFDPCTAGFDPAAKLADVRCPVIAVVKGTTSSVGLELALAADIRIGGESTRCSVPDVVLGRLPCWGGTQRLPRVVGPARALMMMLLASELDGAQSLADGLVHELAGDPDARAAELARSLAELAPLALESAKETVREGIELPLRVGLRMEGDANHLLMTTQDRAEGLGAFLDKRPPKFTGQ